MIQASSLRPESTLSLSQAILKTFTRAISFIQRKRGVFFYPCRPALTDYQTHFQRGVFFTRLEPGPIFFRLRRSVVAGWWSSAAPLTQCGQRGDSTSQRHRDGWKLQHPHISFIAVSAKICIFFQLKCFNSTRDLHNAPHKLEFTIKSIICLWVYVHSNLRQKWSVKRTDFESNLVYFHRFGNLQATRPGQHLLPKWPVQ